MSKIGFIGAGNMAYALAKAFSLDASSQILVSDPSVERTNLFNNEIKNVIVCSGNIELCERSDIIILAVKPQIMPIILDEINDLKKIVVSIAAGISLSQITASLPESKIARLMPNTPCLIGKMAGGICFSANMPTAEKTELVELFRKAGTVVEVTESKMDAVTGLSGSGPAFVARLIESFRDAGVAEGLSLEDSYQLALMTFSGTADLLIEKSLSPDELVKMVSSPKGTTVAGREVLESSSYRDIVQSTVSAAAQRSRELGK